MKKKLFLSFVICATLLISGIISASAETYGDLTYEIVDGEITITDCKDSTSGRLTIPSEINGYPVTKIGDDAFYKCIYLEHITIPDSVNYIGSFAFGRCQRLRSVNIPDKVTTINYGAFSHCRLLNNITIPDSIVSIQGRAFDVCRELKNITIPNSVTYIDNSAFDSCSSLTSITIDNHNPNYSSENGVLFNKDKTVLLRCLPGKSGAYVISDSVTTIAYHAFYGCESLTKVTIPDSVTSIGNLAFQSCYKLTSVTIGNGVTSISQQAFDGCESLTSINIPDSVSSIEDCAFQECESLTNISIPDSVTSIGKSAFYNCTSLAKVTMGKNVTFIGENAFQYCQNLKTIILPNGITSISRCMFSGCYKLTSITIPDSVTFIDDYVFSNCINLTNITIGNNVTSINQWAFSGCTSLRSVIIPASVTSIKYGVFNKCTNLTDVYYGGSYDEWNKFREKNSRQSDNECLWNAKIHYNSSSALNHDITINNNGRAYARFDLHDKNGNALKNTAVTYSYQGYDIIYSATTDANGVATVVTPTLSGNGEVKAMTVIFKSPEMKQNQFSFNVTITPLSFSQTWEGKISGEIGAELSLGVSGKIGILEAEAKLASIGASFKPSKTFSVTDSYDKGVRTLTLSNELDVSVANDAQIGLFAKAGVTGKDKDKIVSLAPLAINGNIESGYNQEYSLKIDNYDPSNANHLLKVSRFLLDSATGINGSNVFLRKILELWNLESYNESGTTQVAKFGAGANVGSASIGSIGGDLIGFSSDAVFSSGTYTDSDNQTVHTSGISTAAGIKIGNLSYKEKASDESTNYFSDASTSASFWSRDFFNNNATISASDAVDMVSINSLEKNNNYSILWWQDIENTYQNITFTGAEAQKLASDEANIMNLANGKKSFFTGKQMTNAISTAINSGYTANYSREKELERGIDENISFGLTALVGIDFGIAFSGIKSTEYEIEKGILTDGRLYTTSISNIDTAVKNNEKALVQILSEPVIALKNKVLGYLNIISGAVKDGLEWGKAKIRGTKDWICNISALNDNSNITTSYSILALNYETSLFSTSSIASTVGEPYIISITDNDGNEITDFSESPLTLSLSYDSADLSAAGLENTESALENLKIYYWDTNKSAYVYIGGELDFANSSVTAQILKPGQYILAIDNCPPTITNFNISDGTGSPTISAIVSDMSGISEFEFEIDDVVIVDTQSFENYYNPVTSVFEYKVAEPLASGEHTAKISATDTSGNTMAQPIVLPFTVDTLAPTINNIGVPTIVSNGELNISASAFDENLSNLSVYIEYDDNIYSYPMTETDNEWTICINELPEFTKIKVWIRAYDSVGNSTESDKYTVSVYGKTDKDLSLGIFNIDSHNVSVAISHNGETITGNLMVAGFDANGVLNAIKIEEYTCKGCSEKIIKMPSEYDIYKVFFWDELYTTKPLCESITYSNY